MNELQTEAHLDTRSRADSFARRIMNELAMEYRSTHTQRLACVRHLVLEAMDSITTDAFAFERARGVLRAHYLNDVAFCAENVAAGTRVAIATQDDPVYVRRCAWEMLDGECQSFRRTTNPADVIETLHFARDTSKDDWWAVVRTAMDDRRDVAAIFTALAFVAFRGDVLYTLQSIDDMGEIFRTKGNE